MEKHAHKIASELTVLGTRVSEARDTYQALIAERDEMIYRLIAIGVSPTEIARYAGLTREQVSRMANKK